MKKKKKKKKKSFNKRSKRRQYSRDLAIELDRKIKSQEIRCGG